MQNELRQLLHGWREKPFPGMEGIKGIGIGKERLKTAVDYIVRSIPFIPPFLLNG